jgi:hypothetical protein
MFGWRVDGGGGGAAARSKPAQCSYESNLLRVHCIDVLEAVVLAKLCMRREARRSPIGTRYRLQ